MALVERTARARVAAIPGVESASFSGILLFSPSDIGATFTIPGYQPPDGAALSARYNSVSPGYFETIGMQLVAGRTIQERDDIVGAPVVAVVNESMAQRFFARRVDAAIGRTLVLAAGPAGGKRAQIVGVVRDAKYNNLRENAKPMFYLPYAQMTRTLRSLEVRTTQPESAIAAPVRTALAGVTRDLMIRRIVRLADQVDSSLAAERLLLRLCLVFGGLALLLACVGLYGVIAYSVAQRTMEIGVRVALGATPMSVMRGVLRDTLLLVAAGIAIGIPAALAAGRLIVTFLYGVTPRDPGTMSLAILVLTAAAAAAAALPALRAARVDPNVALRCE
jgi:predicted permease